MFFMFICERKSASISLAAGGEIVPMLNVGNFFSTSALEVDIENIHFALE